VNVSEKKAFEVCKRFNICNQYSEQWKFVGVADVKESSAFILRLRL